MVGCGSMWQGVEACGRGGGRVWVHVAGVGTCGRGQTYGIDRDMWQWWGHVVGCGSIWQGVEAGRGGHVTGVRGLC